MFRRKHRNKSPEQPAQQPASQNMGSLAVGGALQAAETAQTSAISQAPEQANLFGSRKGRYESRYSARITDVSQLRTVEVIDHERQRERPADAVIAELQKDDPRIDVVHLPAGSDIDEVLADRLDRDFAGEPLIALRSVQASIDGLVTDGSIDIHDIRDILRMGDIFQRSTVNLAYFRPGGEDTGLGRIHYRVKQFAGETDYIRDYEMQDAEGTERIFPAILIYDDSMVKNGESHHYRKILPQGEAERQQLIRKAYILDADIGSY